MELKSRIDEVAKTMNNSPIRSELRESRSLPCDSFGSNANILDELINDIYTIRNQMDEPFKIVLMGEVNSGKSTLLNTILADKVSPVDIFEATAVILEVAYGAKEKGVINYKDGTSHEDTIEGIYRLLSKNQNNIEFSSTVSRVRIYKPDEEYKKYNFVDTPGLAAMTESNVNTTRCHIQKSDLIIWCLNANCLGDEAVIRELQYVNTYGKPMICVITHVDEIEGDPNRALEYVKMKGFGKDFKSTFIFSGKEALKHSLSKDLRMLEGSGLSGIKNYLDDKYKANENISKEKRDSIASSLDSVVKKDIKYHNLMLFDLAALQESVSDVNKDLLYHEELINKKVMDWVICKIHSEYLEPEYIEMKNIIKSSQELSEMEIMEIERRLSKDSIGRATSKFTESIKGDMKTYLLQEWSDASNIMEEKIGKYLNEYYKKRGAIFGEDDSEISVNRDISVNIKKEGISDIVKRDLVTAGGIGIGLSAWMAWFSAAAPWVAFLPAMASLVPIVLLAAAPIILFRVKNRTNKLSGVEIETQIRKIIDDVKKGFSKACTEKKFLQPIYQQNSEVCRDIMKKYKSQIFYEWTDGELMCFEKDIKLYVRSLESINELL